MSEFFNQKDEVLDIQLTQYGKYLLSKGIFKPDSYAFHDNDIIYDSRYTNHSESQNSTHSRIKTALRPKTQYVYRGIETENNKANLLRSLNFGKDINKPQASGDRSYALHIPMGTGNPNSDKSPAWNVFFGKSPLSSSVAHYSGSHGVINIPQIEMMHKLTTQVGMDQAQAIDEFTSPFHTEHEIFSVKSNMAKFTEEHGQQPEVFSISEEFQDGTFLFEEQDYVFLSVKEENSLNLKENFDIEVFDMKIEIDGITGKSKEVLRQLEFLPTPTEVDNFIKESGLGIIYPSATPDHVEYYFTIDVDNDIEERILCEVDFSNNKEDIFSDANLEFDCINYPHTEVPISYSEKQIGFDTSVDNIGAGGASGGVGSGGNIGAIINVPEGEEDPCE